MKRLKIKIYEMIDGVKDNNIESKIFDFTIISLIIINTIIIIIDTLNIPQILSDIFYIIEIVSIIIFTLEYILRLWTSNFIYPDKKPYRARIKYVFTFMALIDLLAILPFYIPFIIPIDLRVLRILRLARLLRLLKANRYTKAFHTIGTVLKNKTSQLVSSMVIILMLMIVSSILMYNFENAAQPDKFSNALSGMWWATATFTTVGYGDIYPITAIGKVLGSVIAILGIGLVAVPTGIISAGFIESINSKEVDKEKGNKCYCPYCGKKL